MCAAMCAEQGSRAGLTGRRMPQWPRGGAGRGAGQCSQWRDARMWSASLGPRGATPQHHARVQPPCASRAGGGMNGPQHMCVPRCRRGARPSTGQCSARLGGCTLPRYTPMKVLGRPIVRVRPGDHVHITSNMWHYRGGASPYKLYGPLTMYRHSAPTAGRASGLTTAPNSSAHMHW